jgi:DNA invertase Pin-like site-specific DNA recombinase
MPMKDKELAIQTHPLITPDHLRRNAVVYIRQSTQEQVRDNTGSTEFQRRLADVARSFGWQESQIEIIDEDLGRSGSSDERRTGWQRLHTMVAAKQVGAVFVATISRLSRQVLDFEIFRMLAAANRTLLYTDGRLVDPADSNDTIVAQITAMVAHFENSKRTEIMSQARRIKAKQGAVVSTLPVGWIETPGGDYDYDPAIKDRIRTIIDTFWQTRSLRRTVFALEKAGIQIPARHGQRISFIKPTLNRVRLILLNPAYAGTYVFGKTQSQPGGPVLANGQSKRMKVPEEDWIKIFDHHPAYLTREQQEEIKTILNKNLFTHRYRAGRGPALLQGLLRCAICNRSFNVTYRQRHSYTYRCAWEIKRCTRFTSCEFEQFVLVEAFKILESPPFEMLKAALEESRNQERSRLEWIKSERERLAHEERVARDRADLAQGSYERVHRDALEKLEEVLAEKEQFEQKIAITSVTRANRELDGTELEELCRLAGEVPSLWHHPAVTHQERKEILRCLIDYVVVAGSRERIEAGRPLGSDFYVLTLLASVNCPAGE